MYEKCSLLLFGLNQNWNVLTNFRQTSQCNINENPFSGSHVITVHPDRWTYRHSEAYRYISVIVVNAPKK
jgi:hypothetical protein